MTGVNTQRTDDLQIGEFEYRASNIMISELTERQNMMQKQMTENLLEMSINFDENNIIDLHAGDLKYKSSKEAKSRSITNSMNGQKSKAEDNLKYLLLKEKLPLDQIKKVITAPKSARMLQDYTSKAFNTQFSSSSQNSKQNPSFSLLLDSDRIKLFNPSDANKSGLKESKFKPADLNRSSKNLGRSVDPVNPKETKKNSIGRFVAQRVSADQLDFNFPKAGQSKKEILTNSKNLKQARENNTNWAEVFKKACNKNK